MANIKDSILIRETVKQYITNGVKYAFKSITFNNGLAFPKAQGWGPDPDWCRIYYASP